MSNRVRMGLAAAGVALVLAAYFTSDWVWLKARLGGNDSQLVLAYAYATGEGGVEKDDAEAFRWYLRAAEGGDPRGQQEVARRYDEGLGVERNSDEATRWYQAAAEQSHPAAQLALARRHREGRGVPQDNVRAAMWLILSHDYALSQPEGSELRDALRAELDEGQLAQARALAAEWRTAHGIVMRRVDKDGNPIEGPPAEPGAGAPAEAGTPAAAKVPGAAPAAASPGKPKGEQP